MTELFLPIPTAIATFVATNVDDILILTLLFAQVNVLFRRREIVIGQYLGFMVLLIISLSGFFGRFLLPSDLIRGLGLIPLFLGLMALKGEGNADSPTLETLLPNSAPSHGLKRWLSPQVSTVAAVTVANGSDNISIYVPLFASSTAQSLIITLTTFLLLVGIWCGVADRLTRLPAIAALLTHQGHRLVPCLLIALGVYILKESLVLTLLSLVISYLWTLSLQSPDLSPED